MCSCADFEADFTSVRRVRARKEHRCEECRRVIRRDDIHDRVAVGLDGTIDVSRQCVLCARLNHAYHALSTEDCNPPWGELRECVVEMIRNDQATLEKRLVAAFLTPADWEWQHILFQREKALAA